MKMKLVSTVILALLCSSLFAADELFNLDDFSSDGCSAYPDGYPFTKENEWIHCCITHDMSYWYGGTKAERREADDLLNQCIEDVTSKLHGSLMEAGVFLGGTPYLPTQWRWGYGWNERVSYQTLTNIQRQELDLKFDTILSSIEDKKLNGEIDQNQVIFLVREFEKLRLKVYKQYGVNQNRTSNEDHERMLRILELIRDPSIEI